VTDKLTDGKSFRVLTVVDQFTRQCIAPSAGDSMTVAKAAEALRAAANEYGAAPESITVDNGNEFTDRAFELWARPCA